jgi:hypothetical protein
MTRPEQVIVDDIMSDAIEPGRELGSRFEFRERFPDLEENLLR